MTNMLFFDFSARLKLKDITYIGLGYSPYNVIMITSYNNDTAGDGVYLCIGLEF